MKTRFRIGMMPAAHEGPNARSWADIEAFYSGLASGNDVFTPLADLAQGIARSAFVKAGLCAATSMHDLCLGPSAMVFQNPHLRIAYDFDTGTFSLIYVDGSTKPWERHASPEHALGLVTRFLTKRARWYSVPPKSDT